MGYTIEINGTEYDYNSLTFTETHPKESPDRFDVIIRGYKSAISFGDEVVIKKNGVVVWKGLVEEITIEA